MDNSFYINHLKQNKNITIIDKNFKFMIYTIYKNASSKINQELNENYEFNKSIKNLGNKEKISMVNQNNDFILNKLNNFEINKIYKIAFVRNPIDRFVSLFYYFKGSKRGRLMQIFDNTNINVWTINYFSKNYKKLEFVSNYHFNSQSSFLYYNNYLIPDELIFLEKIDYKKLEINGIFLSKKKINVSKKEEIKLSEQSVNIIKTVYKEDYCNFYSNLI